MKRNPRKVTWTVLYRRKHKKGIEEETTRKRTRRTQKFQRAIVGASLNEILAKRNMKPEVRKAQREQAIKWVYPWRESQSSVMLIATFFCVKIFRAAKDQKKATKAAKKTTAPAAKKAAPKQKATKVSQKAAPRVGGKR